MKPWEFRGRRSERNAPVGTLCNRSGCTAVRPTPTQAHCTVCHETFGGVTGFDNHRKDGWCHNPATLAEPMIQDYHGVWRRPRPVGVEDFAVVGAQPLPGL